MGVAALDPRTVATGQREREPRECAEELHGRHAHGDAVLGPARRGADDQLLRSDAERERRARGHAGHLPVTNARGTHARPSGPRVSQRGQQVHLSDEARDEQRARLHVDLHGRTDLLHAAVVHHHDAIRHGERLFLIVGHHDRGDAEPPLEVLDLVAQREAHARVQRRQRLVEEQQRRRRRERARERHALLLAAGELRGIAVLVRRQMDEVEQLVHPRRNPRAIDLSCLQAVGDVAGDRQVREQRIRLEDDAVVPLTRR